MEPHLSSGPSSLVRRVTAPGGASLVPMSVPARGGLRKKPRVASLGRVTYRRYVVGPRPSARDRSAGDSSPVTPRAVGSGDARGRPHPVQTVAHAAARPARCKRSASPSARNNCQRSIPPERRLCAGAATFPTRRYPPAPRLGTGAALTSVLTPKGPAVVYPRGPWPASRGPWPFPPAPVACDGAHIKFL